MSRVKRVTTAAAPVAPADGAELSDSDLEHVVGGLTRRFVGPATPYDYGRGIVDDPGIRP
jgi:hypothetical protein